ncbi:MAG: hypothetical protein R2942_10875 [Ignavibacteria bacterium]
MDLKLSIEGFYNNSTNTLNMSDTVTAHIRSISSPFEIIDTSKAVIDSATLTGNFNFRNTPTGTYYIAVKHRNSPRNLEQGGRRNIYKRLNCKL